MSKSESSCPWNAEQIKLLKEEWVNGVSGREIADKFNLLYPQYKMKRSAVLGKAHRLKLAERRIQGVKKPKVQQAKLKSFPRKKRKKLVNLPVVASITIVRKTLAPAPLPNRQLTVRTLTNETCKWPVGNPGEDDFCFCGHKPRDRSPYCEYHSRQAHQPQKTNRPVYVY